MKINARTCKADGRITTLTKVLLAILWTLVVPLSSSAQLPNLTGTWQSDDGGIYYMQQSGNVLWWAGMSLDRDVPADQQWHRGLNFTNVFRGTFTTSTTITGDWVEVSRGLTLNSGTLTLAVDTSGTAPILTRTGVTGLFNGEFWIQTGPLDDTQFNGSTQDIPSRFDNVHKNAADGSTTIHSNLKPYRDETVVYAHVVTRRPATTTACCPFRKVPLIDDQAPHVNYGPNFLPTIPNGPDSTISFRDFGSLGRDWESFACYSSNDQDADYDFRLKVDTTLFEPDFYTTGWGDRDGGPQVFQLKFGASPTFTGISYANYEAYLGAEAIMYGKPGVCLPQPSPLPPVFSSDDPTGGSSMLPGWADLSSNSVLINGRPINGSATNHELGSPCPFIQPCPYIDPLDPSPPDQGLNNGIQVGNLRITGTTSGQYAPAGDTYMRVTGALILDCGHFSTNIDDFGHTCDDDLDDLDQVTGAQNQEIHPIYSIDIINHPFRPEDINQPRVEHSLTGAWGGTDGSTYYVRQIGSTVWFLGLMRDRQPLQPLCPDSLSFFCGTNFPMIGTNELAPAFQAGDPPCSTSPYQCWAFGNVFKGTITDFTDGSSKIQGDWAGVPQSTSAGSSGGSMTFFVNFNRKLIVPGSPSIFPVLLTKLYEPAEDVVPPQSTLTIGAPQYPGTVFEKYVTSATPLTLAGTDQESGMQNVWYRFYPAGIVAPVFTAALGSTMTFNVTGGDGEYNVEGYATDNAGNNEFGLGHVNQVHLDNTPPQITINQPAGTSYPHSATLTLNYSVDDGPGSGVKSITPAMDGKSTLPDGTGLSSGQSINLLTQLSLGTHTFSVNAADNLNNAGGTSITFTVVVTPDSIAGDVNQFLQSGAIDNNGIASSLLAKLTSAAAARGRGDCSGAAAIYQAFINELQAQGGKHVNSTAAQIMIQDAQYLIAHCP